MTIEKEGGMVLQGDTFKSQQFISKLTVNTPPMNRSFEPMQGNSYVNSNDTSLNEFSFRQENGKSGRGINFENQFEHNKQQKMLVASLEMQHAQLEQVNEII